MDGLKNFYTDYDGSSLASADSASEDVFNVDVKNTLDPQLTEFYEYSYSEWKFIFRLVCK